MLLTMLTVLCVMAATVSGALGCVLVLHVQEAKARRKVIERRLTF